MVISLQTPVVLWSFMLSASSILGLSLEMMHLQGAINDTFYTWLNPATGSLFLQIMRNFAVLCSKPGRSSNSFSTCSPTRSKPHFCIFTCPWTLRCLKASIYWRKSGDGGVFLQEGSEIRMQPWRDLSCRDTQTVSLSQEQVFADCRLSGQADQSVQNSDFNSFLRSLSCKMGTLQKTLKICR